MEKWNGRELSEELRAFHMESGTFRERDYIIVYPKSGTANGRWMLKTEYFGAFPEAEVALLKQGYHLAHVNTKTRWCLEEDTEVQAAFIQFVHEKWGLAEKCVPVGMSCGGMQAIYLAAKYPECVSCMYVDAPVVNLLSCPAALGKSKIDALEEFVTNRGMDLIDLLSYRKHPLDYLPQLTKQDIPVVLVSGDADTIVPFDENGIFLKQAYEEKGRTIETYIKPGGDHHPHGLPDNTPIVRFILKYDK